MMAYLVGGEGGGGGGRRVSVGSEVHTADYSFSYYLLSIAHFCIFRGLLFTSFYKAKNFVKYAIIYNNTTLFFYTFASHFSPIF